MVVRGADGPSPPHRKEATLLIRVLVLIKIRKLRLTIHFRIG